MGLRDGLGWLRRFTPARAAELARERLAALLEAEVARSRRRVVELQTKARPEGTREHARALIEAKKRAAMAVGGAAGMFGAAAIPADLLARTYLELSLLVDIAVLHGVHLKSPRERRELLEIFARTRGITLGGGVPRLLGALVGRLARTHKLGAAGRAIPLLAAPFAAYLDEQKLEEIGQAAIAHYDGFARASAKRRSTPDGS